MTSCDVNPGVICIILLIGWRGICLGTQTWRCDLHSDAALISLLNRMCVGVCVCVCECAYVCVCVYVCGCVSVCMCV